MQEANGQAMNGHDYETKLFHRDGDGLRPLRASVRLLGEGDAGDRQTRHDRTRGTDVTIYAAQAGGYIVHRQVWSKWQGEATLDYAHRCADAHALLALLERDSRLGAAELDALTNAAQHDDALAAVAVEDLDHN